MNVLSVSVTNSIASIVFPAFISIMFLVVLYLALTERPEAAWLVYILLTATTITIPFLFRPNVMVETRVETMAEFEELSKDWKLVSISDDQIFTLEKR